MPPNYPLPKKEAAALVLRRHPEWLEHEAHWRWLADSLEGGDRYRYADYSARGDAPGGGRSPASAWAALPDADPQTGEAQTFAYDSIVKRNLVPHRSEMDRSGFALYAMRLARTPTPTALARTVESHLSKVFAREVKREGPKALEDWWEDVDGRKTPVRRFIEDVAAPLLLALGQIDVVVDHPPRPEGVGPEAVRSKADEAELGLGLAVPGVILPESVLWWRLDNRGRYVELLTLERPDDPGPDDKHGAWYRHWHAEGSDAYLPSGDHLPARSHGYGYGRVPVVRVFDRKKPRCRNVGRSRYAGIAELQRAAYNAESERILADVHGSHPTLQAPSDATGPNATVRVGPGGVLPMVPLTGPDGAVSGYQGWSYLDPPTGTQASLRDHLADISDAIDRDGAIAKPAGIAGGQATGQSGVSKVMDSLDGKAVLSRISEVIEVFETELAGLALLVLSDGPPPAGLAEIEIAYPKTFDLDTVEDAAGMLTALQDVLANLGNCPTAEIALVKRFFLLGYPGAPEALIKEVNAEFDAFSRERGDAARRSPAPPEPFGREAEGDPETDPFAPTEEPEPDGADRRSPPYGGSRALDRRPD